MINSWFDMVTTMPMSVQFFVYMGIVLTGLIILYVLVFIHNLRHPELSECPDWADPERWEEFLAYEAELKKRKWWE